MTLKKHPRVVVAFLPDYKFLPDVYNVIIFFPTPNELNLHGSETRNSHEPCEQNMKMTIT